MKFDVITIFPGMFQEIFKWGVIRQGIKSRLLEISIHDLRDFTEDKHRQVDDRPFGGGAGMVLKPEPLFKAIETISLGAEQKPHVVFLTPQGKTYSQQKAEELSSKHSHIILICGRYEGVDQRVRDKLVDEEISIGEYVLSGGEIPAMVLIDSVSRLIPGVIQNEEFNTRESYSNPENRAELDHPQYTRPENFRDMGVPQVLLSGNHKEIEKWRNGENK